MSHPSWEDLDLFFDPDDFAVAAVIDFQSGGNRLLNGILNIPTERTSLAEYDQIGDFPHFVCRADEAVGVMRGDTLTVDAQAYDIIEAPELDGTGIARIKLSVPG